MANAMFTRNQIIKPVQTHINLPKKRLQRELQILKKEPVPYFAVEPSTKDLSTWHFLIFPPSYPYNLGEYHGFIKFPKDYPYKPPAIFMETPSGRFEINKSLCLSMSEYHPETWNPLWSIASILTGLLSYMLEETTSVGVANLPNDQRVRLAKESRGYNAKNKLHNTIFGEDNLRVAQLREERAIREEEANLIEAVNRSARPKHKSSMTQLAVIGISALILCVVSSCVLHYLSLNKSPLL